MTHFIQAPTGTGQQDTAFPRADNPTGSHHSNPTHPMKLLPAFRFNRQNGHSLPETGHCYDQVDLWLAKSIVLY